MEGRGGGGEEDSRGGFGKGGLIVGAVRGELSGVLGVDRGIGRARWVGGVCSSAGMSNARLREALNAGNTAKEKGPPAADGVLTVTKDAAETAELRSRRSAIDCCATSSTYLEDEGDGRVGCVGMIEKEIFVCVHIWVKQGASETRCK